MSATSAGSVRSRPFCITARVSDDRQRHDRQPGFDREQEAAGLEAPDAAVHAAGAFREDDERQPVAHERPPAAQDAGAIRVSAVDEQVAAALQVPAEDRKPRQRLLRDDPQLIGSDAKITGMS